MDQDNEAILGFLHQGAFEEAEARVQTVLRTNPWLAEDARRELLLHQATACARQIEFGRAIELAMGLLESGGENLDQRLMAVRTLCVGLTHLGMPEVARSFISEAVFPHSPHCSDRCWAGRLLMLTGDNEAALRSFNQVQEDFPGHTFVRHCIGMARMALGDSGGLLEQLELTSRDYWRMFLPHASYPEKMWEGEALAGRSITIVPHGGYGDYFQFLRFVPGLRRAGVREIVAVAHENCHGLIAGAGIDRVVGLAEGDRAKAETDCWASVFALERLVFAGESRAAPHAYLTAPPSAAAEQILPEMRARAGGRPCIGLYWFSDAHGGDEKSLALSDLMPLLTDDSVHWVILQRGFGLRRLRASGLHGKMTVLDEVLSFDETAGVIAGLDGVVTICAWPLHLAGALGVRTWFLASRAMTYRHENREHESVLYPGTVTLVRQPRLGDWRGAVAMLKEELYRWRHQRYGLREHNAHDAHSAEPKRNDTLPDRPYALAVRYQFRH